MMVSYKKMSDEKIEFEVYGEEVEDDEYVAFGLSEDDTMGDDLVFACTKEGVYKSFNHKDKRNVYLALEDSEDRSVQIS